jgi:hypothetical protein
MELDELLGFLRGSKKFVVCACEVDYKGNKAWTLYLSENFKGNAVLPIMSMSKLQRM